MASEDSAEQLHSSPSCCYQDDPHKVCDILLEVSLIMSMHGLGSMMDQAYIVKSYLGSSLFCHDEVDNIAPLNIGTLLRVTLICTSDKPMEIGIAQVPRLDSWVGLNLSF